MLSSSLACAPAVAQMHLQVAVTAT